MSIEVTLTMAPLSATYPRHARRSLGGRLFVVGAAQGADTMAQAFLAHLGANVRVLHMLERPRNNAHGFPTTLLARLWDRLRHGWHDW